MTQKKSIHSPFTQPRDIYFFPNENGPAPAAGVVPDQNGPVPAAGVPNENPAGATGFGALAPAAPAPAPPLKLKLNPAPEAAGPPAGVVVVGAPFAVAVGLNANGEAAAGPFGIVVAAAFVAPGPPNENVGFPAVTAPPPTVSAGFTPNTDSVFTPPPPNALPPVVVVVVVGVGPPNVPNALVALPLSLSPPNGNAFPVEPSAPPRADDAPAPAPDTPEAEGCPNTDGLFVDPNTDPFVVGWPNTPAPAPFVAAGVEEDCPPPLKLNLRPPPPLGAGASPAGAVGLGANANPAGAAGLFSSPAGFAPPPKSNLGLVAPAVPEIEGAVIPNALPGAVVEDAEGNANPLVAVAGLASAFFSSTGFAGSPNENPPATGIAVVVVEGAAGFVNENPPAPVAAVGVDVEEEVDGGPKNVEANAAPLFSVVGAGAAGAGAVAVGGAKLNPPAGLTPSVLGVVTVIFGTTT